MIISLGRAHDERSKMASHITGNALGEVEEALEQYRRDLQDAGLKTPTIDKYYGRARLFVHWLGGGANVSPPRESPADFMRHP